MPAGASIASRVLVLYDHGKDPDFPAMTEARYIENLMGHFNTSVQVVPISEYRTGMMEKNDVIFYMTYEKKFELPENFKSDFYRTSFSTARTWGLTRLVIRKKLFRKAMTM